LFGDRKPVANGQTIVRVSRKQGMQCLESVGSEGKGPSALVWPASRPGAHEYSQLPLFAGGALDAYCVQQQFQVSCNQLPCFLACNVGAVH